MVFRRGHHHWDLISFFRFLCDRDFGQKLVLLGVSQSRPCMDVIRGVPPPLRHLNHQPHLENWSTFRSSHALLPASLTQAFSKRRSLGPNYTNSISMRPRWTRSLKPPSLDSNLASPAVHSLCTSLSASTPKRYHLSRWRLSCWRNTPECTHVHLTYSER